MIPRLYNTLVVHCCICESMIEVRGHFLSPVETINININRVALSENVKGYLLHVLLFIEIGYIEKLLRCESKLGTGSDVRRDILLVITTNQNF